MLKSTVLIALVVVGIAHTHAKPDAPVETKTVQHHYHVSTVQHQHHGQPPHGQQAHVQSQHGHGQSQHGHGQSQHGHGQHGHHGNSGGVKIRQSGPSKIFGWLGSRFAKIPQYLPRFPQFPKQNSAPQKLPQYQAIILPDPPKAAGYGKVRSPQKVKITTLEQVEQESESQVDSYHDIASIPEIYENSYTPVPIASESYSIPESVPQIEVVPSTLLYSNKQIIHPPQLQASASSHKPVAPAPIAAPPLQYYSASHASYNAIPAPVRKPAIYQVQAHKQPGTVPIVPQSTGPDYFDTAYRSPNEQQFLYKQIVPAPAPAPAPAKESQVQQSLEYTVNNNGAMYDVQGQGVPQVYDSSINLAAIGGPVISSTAQQATYDAASAQSGYTQTQHYANQALNNQALSSLVSSLPDSGLISTDQNNNYGQYSQMSEAVAPAPDTANNVAAAASQQQPQYTYQDQAQAQASGSYQKTDIPGVQILSQGSDGGNPVFEVLADANAPSYNGHPFDINKLISMIEPGAEVESTELSHAASETKTTYVAPMTSPTSATSGINDLILSESDPSPSVTQVNGSKVVLPSPPSNLNVKSKLNNSSSSLKEIMDFFQQTGGKGYIVVEKKRHRSDNLTHDSDQTRDDDLTNGPTRVNITSDSIFPQLELLEHEQEHETESESENENDRPSTQNDYSNNSEADTINNIPTDLLFPLDSPKYADYDGQDHEDYDHDDLGGNDKLKNSFNFNHIPSNNDKRQKTDQTTATSISTVAERSFSNTTTTARPEPVTQVSQLTTLFEPVTPGKPAIFATTPGPIQNGSTLHPNHNYYANPISHSSTANPNYPSFAPLPSVDPTVNSFLDAIDESLLDDDPIETEGDLNASESQQVRSIAITVTPPPRPVYTSTPKASRISKEIPQSSTGSPSGSGTATATTTEGPVTVSPAFLVPATKKTSSGPSKSRPAPVYRGKKAGASDSA